MEPANENKTHKMIPIYKTLMKWSAPALRAVLRRRMGQGKEDPARIKEREGIPSLPRPKGDLIWFHAASVGEAQSTLILMHRLEDKLKNAHILITTGTLTSAEFLKTRLPAQAIHQYIPLDHPGWVAHFLDQARGSKGFLLHVFLHLSWNKQGSELL